MAEEIERERQWHDAGFKKEARGLYSREMGRNKKHPLAIELCVNCAECGHLLAAEVVSSFTESTKILITVEKCPCG